MESLGRVAILKLYLRVSELRLIGRLATTAGESRSTWARRLLLQAAKKQSEHEARTD